MADRETQTLARNHGMGRIQFEPADAGVRGFMPIGVDLAYRRELSATAFVEPSTLVQLQAPPGATGGLVLVGVRELESSVRGITEYARTHARGLELEVGCAEKVRIAGVDRWVAFTVVRTHRGHLATGWALFPSVVEGEAVVAVAWIEGPREDLGAEQVVDAYNDELGSLLLKFEGRMTFGDARGVVCMDSRGGVRLTAVEGDGRGLEESVVAVDLSTGGRSDVDFTARLRCELAALGVTAEARRASTTPDVHVSR